MRLFFGAKDHDIYEEATRRGGTLLSANVQTDDEIDTAQEIMDG